MYGQSHPKSDTAEAVRRLGYSCIYCSTQSASTLDFAFQVSQQYATHPMHHTLPPHIFAVAGRAFQSLLREQKAQCCVISGESGSGKTESCKYVIQHVLTVSQSEESNLNSKIQQVSIRTWGQLLGGQLLGGTIAIANIKLGKETGWVGNGDTEYVILIFDR